MARGFSLIELVFVLCIIALLASIGLPRLQPFLDRIAADRAARDVTTALAVARHGAVLQGMRARLTIDADSLRIDRLEPAGWTPWRRWLGPAALRVDLAVSNPEVVFGPTGMGWGVSNTKVVLRRGSQVETITVSRVGRVKRW
ncbi:MAG TPA: type II secretion system protein [Gemmatimonadales bacterium]|nr:type II secretion system protein [Gemmatimonadales bacterium]